MRQTSMTILWLYPAEYREAFGPEIVDTIAQRAGEACLQGLAAYAAFATGEFAGLLLGALREWTTKWTARDGYMSPPDFAVEAADVPDLQRRIQQLIRGMEFAIANHDFPKARLYSDRERIMRARLDRLLSAGNLYQSR